MAKPKFPATKIRPGQPPVGAPKPTLKEQLAQQERDRTGGSFHPQTVLGMTVHPGITIRDYFAGKFIDSCRAVTNNVEESARAAYKFADAMIAVRKEVRRG